MTDINPRDLIRRLADDLEGITEELVIPEYAHTEKERTDASLALIAEARDYLCQAESHAPIGAANRIAHYAVEACLAEWGPVNDPPCHPDDEGWNGCHLCVKRDLIAAELEAT